MPDVSWASASTHPTLAHGLEILHTLADEYLADPDDGFDVSGGVRQFVKAETRKKSVDWLLEHMPTPSADAAQLQWQGKCTLRDLLLVPTVASSDPGVMASDSFGTYKILNGNELVDLSLLSPDDPRRSAHSKADLGVLMSMYIGRTWKHHADWLYAHAYRPQEAGFWGRFIGSKGHLNQAQPDAKSCQLLYSHPTGGMRHTDTHIMKGFFMGELLALAADTFR
jgi:hypothetical protein